MKNKPVLLLITGLTLAVSLIILSNIERRESTLGKHKQIIPLLENLLSLEQQLLSNLSVSHSNGILHFDKVVVNLKDITSELKTLKPYLVVTEENGISLGKIRFQKLKGSYVDYEKKIERLMSDIAAVRNSLKYLPILVLESAISFDGKLSEEVQETHLKMLGLLNFSLLKDDTNWDIEFEKLIRVLSSLNDTKIINHSVKIAKHVELIQFFRPRISLNYSVIQKRNFSGNLLALLSFIVETNNAEMEASTQIKFLLLMAVFIVSGFAMIGFYRSSKQTAKLAVENLYRSRINGALGKLAKFDNRKTTDEFLDLCVKSLQEASDCYIAIVAFFVPGSREQLEAVSVFTKDGKQENFIYELKGTPCENVILYEKCSFESKVASLYPDDLMLKELGIDAYFGRSLIDQNGEPIGLIALTYQKETKSEIWLASMIKIFAIRISVELDRSQAIESLSCEREEALTTLNAIADGVIQVDFTGFITAVNPPARRLLGLDINEKLSKKHISNISDDIDSIANGELLQQVMECIQTKKASVGGKEILLFGPHDDKEPKFIITLSVAPVFDKLDNVQGVIGVMRDVSRELKFQQELAYQASHDNLTGLLNRRALDIHLNKVLSNVSADKPCALLYIDMDRFKIVNDTCGHSAGDLLLQEFSILLHENLRDNDILARLGGDEFFILLNGCSLIDAEHFATKIINRINAFRFFWEKQEFEISASIGLTVVDSSQSDSTKVMTTVDLACLEAKSAGRNQYFVALLDEQMISDKKSVGLWIHRLNAAINDDLFELFQQPIVSAIGDQQADKSDRYEKVEILLRMRGEDGELILPHEFLSAAERYDLMPKIDLWVIDNVLARMSGRIELTTLAKAKHVALNLSGQSLASKTLFDYIITKVDEYSIDPRRLCFEVTETAAIGNFMHATKLLNKLQKMGFQFALDDFGSGLSSYGYIKNLPADIIKIDREFTINIMEDKINRAIVRSVINVSHDIGMKVVAEGVEDEETSKILADFGVDYVQGYWFGRPEPVLLIDS